MNVETDDLFRMSPIIITGLKWYKVVSEGVCVCLCMHVCPCGLKKNKSTFGWSAVKINCKTVLPLHNFNQFI